jgi:hypothetical protein
MNDRLATLASEVYSDIEFDANLDEETRKEYETLVSAAFDKTVREMQAMGDDLKGESDEDLKALAKMVETKRKLVEEQAESVDLYGKKVSILTERVKRAAGKVEEEVEIMKGLQQQIQNDPLLRLSNYREQPLSRQVFLVGAFLFFIRGSTDGLTTLLSVGTSGKLDCFDGRDQIELIIFAVPWKTGATAGSAVTQIGVSIALLCVYLFL